MAVPSSGQLSFFGIAKELELNNHDSSKDHDEYVEAGHQSPIPLADMSSGGTGFDTINTNSTDRPDGSTPHSASEFYGYDHDASPAAVSYNVFIAEDWQDGDIGTGTRTAFNVTDLEGGGQTATLFAGGSDNSNPSGVTVTGRSAWTTSPNTTFTQPTVVSDQLRLSNTNNPHGMFMKTTDFSGSPSALNITNIPNDDAVAWRFRFIMNTTNNKDMITDIRMSTVNHSPNPGISTSQYSFMIRDNADPATGGFRFMKRVSTTNTQIGSAPAGTYTLGTTRDFVVSWHRSGTGRSLTFTWKVGMGPTTTPTKDIIDNHNKLSVNDTTYTQHFGWTFRCPKAMTTPSTNVNHKYDVFSIAQIDTGTGGP